MNNVHKLIFVALASAAPLTSMAQNKVVGEPMIAVAATRTSLPMAPNKVATPPEPATPQTSVVAQNTPSAAVAVSPSVAPVPSQEHYTVELRDISLANVVTRWAGQSGWRVRWDADVNFLIDAPNVYTGSFEFALESLLSTPGVAHSAYPLEVCFYSNNPPLARITRRGDQNKECK